MRTLSFWISRSLPRLLSHLHLILGLARFAGSWTTQVKVVFSRAARRWIRIATTVSFMNRSGRQRRPTNSDAFLAWFLHRNLVDGSYVSQSLEILLSFLSLSLPLLCALLRAALAASASLFLFAQPLHSCDMPQFVHEVLQCIPFSIVISSSRRLCLLSCSGEWIA